MTNSSSNQWRQVPPVEPKTMVKPGQPPTPITPQQATRRTLLQQLQQRWNNLTFRAKLTILLVGSAAIPVIVVTQGLVVINKSRALADFATALEGNGKAFTDEYVVWSMVDNQVQVKSLVAIAKATRINLNNAQEVSTNRVLLNEALKIDNASNTHAETHKSFQIITNLQGETVAQNVQQLDLTAPSNQVYQTVPVPSGIDLGDIPIVKQVLNSQKPLAGMELLDRRQLQQLGLEKQADFGLKASANSNPSQPSDPAETGKSDQIGLVSIAVQPIIVNGRLIGTAIAGSLLNNHNDIANQFSDSYGVPICSVFAQSVQVMGSDAKTGEPVQISASQEVIDRVLDQGKSFTVKVTILGKQYLTHYEPLYDHQKELDANTAKPVGMVLVASPLEESETGLNQQQLISYSIGGSMWLLAALVSFPIAASFSNPLRRLTEFAGEVAVGKSRRRFEVLEIINRQDEIGILAQELNQMVDSLATHEKQLRQESEQTRLLADITGARTSNQQELAAVFRQTVEKARSIFGCDRIMLYRFHPGQSGYIAAESVALGLPTAQEENIEDLCIPESLMTTYKTGNPVAITNIFGVGLPPEHLEILERLQVKAHLVAPVFSSQQFLGLLVADFCTALHQWHPSEVDFLKQLAAQLGLVIDRFTLLKETESLAEEQRQRKEELQGRVFALLQAVDPISRGDLTIQAKVTPDEIGTVADSYNTIVASLRNIVTQVQLAANQVTEAASRNESSVQELSEEALQQAAGVAVALEQVEEMANAVQEVAIRAKQAASAAQRATQTVKAGDAAMNRTVNGMEAIQSTVAETTEKVKRLESASQTISTVVELIKSFAQQTNMLALSASIEASRAGEENRGFVVIAKEVQMLAQQSAHATDEIKEAVEQIQTGISEVVIAMKSGTKQVVSGTALVDETRQNLTQISEVSAEISQLVETIAQATIVQSQASETVTRTMKDVTTLANKTSVEVSQVSSSFQQLRKVAQALQEDVGQFKVN